MQYLFCINILSSNFDGNSKIMKDYYDGKNEYTIIIGITLGKYCELCKIPI